MSIGLTNNSKKRARPGEYRDCHGVVMPAAENDALSAPINQHKILVTFIANP